MEAGNPRPHDPVTDWPSRAECRQPEHRPRPRAQAQTGCFVCGSGNTRGLQLHFESTGDGVHAEWTPPPDLEGFRGIIHGGIVSTVLDEAMSKAVIALRCEALTAELRVRFRRALQSSEQVRIQGWVCRRKRRHIETEATLTNVAGEEIAHAWAKFLVVPDSK